MHNSSKKYPEVIEAHIPNDYDKSDVHYFISLLSDRYVSLNDRWAEALKKKFGKTFKPIYVLPFRHNDIFLENYFIVLNKQLQQLNTRAGTKQLISLIYPEDLNKQFSESTFCKLLVNKLNKKQGDLFILSFTSVWLNFDNPHVKVLGPDPKVAGLYDNKIEHVKLFRELKLPTNQASIYKDFDSLKQRHKQFPFFISAAYSSGGIESQTIYTPEDLEIFYAGLRSINKTQPLIAAKQVDDIESAPNATALIHGINKTTVVNISEQLLRGNAYMGNVYPAKISDEHLETIRLSVVKIGNHLSRKGYRGLFGCDFLITGGGRCFPIDLNPRRQGGYLCVATASKTDLIDIELRLALNEPIDRINYEDFQVNYAWGHSKLTPYFNNAYIDKEFSDGSVLRPFEKIGSRYRAQFYPKDHVLIVGNPGFYVTTGKTSEEVKKRLIPEVEKLISQMYRTYID